MYSLTLKGTYNYANVDTCVCLVIQVWLALGFDIMYMYIHVHVLMRDEKEGRKKQAWSNKQQSKATQHTQGSDLYIVFPQFFKLFEKCGFKF